jgi:endonuclease/exonuclease/phosphatase (EEP) superfamily protein YafD
VLVTGFLLGLTLLYLTVGDSTWWGEIVTIWPPFGWCFILAPRLGLLAWRRRFVEAVLTVTFMAAFLAATVEWRSLIRRPDASATARFDEARRHGDATALRVVSWNVAGGAPLADLERLDPDLCLFQESALGGVTLSGRWTGFHYLSGLDPATLSRHAFTPLPTRKVGPWIEPQVFRLDLPNGNRIVVINVRLVLPALVVAVANLEGPRGLIQAHEERKAQFGRLAALVSEAMLAEHTPLAILCGDFNTPGDSRSLAPLRTPLVDVWPLHGVGWGATMTADLPLSRIDQCWVSPAIRPVAAWVQRGQSDHRLLVVDLQLPPT